MDLDSTIAAALSILTNDSSDRTFPRETSEISLTTSGFAARLILRAMAGFYVPPCLGVHQIEATELTAADKTPPVN